MATDTGEYRLSCELRGHEDDIRGICICGDLGIASSSRDRTVKFWIPDSEKKHRFVLSKTLVGHSSFVGPLAWIPPSDRFLEGAIVSGGMDKLVLLWDLSKGEVAERMSGHQQQVTGLVVDDNGDIISSSMDCTLRRWRKGQTVEVWEAHKVAVQAVQKLPTGELVTGSTDSSLKLWKGRTNLHTFLGHTDTVRGLAVMPGLGILSASHDCSIRLWTITGQVLLEMTGHTSLVFSVAAHSSGLVASGSEDCLLKIWKDGICIQSIEHPGCVWDVKFLENGDIVTACSDGALRVWTSHNNRVAEALELETYAFELSEYKCARKKVGGLKLADLPGLEALQCPGSSDGQTLIVREGDNGVAYSWNSKEQKWDKIGEIVDGPGDNTSSQVYNGVRYDHVFDVDIGDGEPIRKLPYNRGENPYESADKWLLKENLPLVYRQQVVEFILQSTGQRDFSLDPSFRDPYTGSSAYVPGPSVPFGGAPKPTFKHIPKKGMLFYEIAQFDGILKKITEFNTELRSNMEQNLLALSDSELSRLAAIINILKDTSHYHCSRFAEIDMVLLRKIVQSWPVTMIFPAIDILRISIMHPDAADLLLKHVKGGNDMLMETFKKATTAPVQTANLLTVTRAIVNLFKHSHFSRWLQLHVSEILDVLSNYQPLFNKNISLAYSTLVLNYTVLLIQTKDKDGQAQILSVALQIVEDGAQDVVSRFQALVAIGSLMLEGLVKSIAVDFDVQSIAKEAKASKDTKIAEVGADIELLLKSS